MKKSWLSAAAICALLTCTPPAWATETIPIEAGISAEQASMPLDDLGDSPPTSDTNTVPEGEAEQPVPANTLPPAPETEYVGEPSTGENPALEAYNGVMAQLDPLLQSGITWDNLHDLLFLHNRLVKVTPTASAFGDLMEYYEWKSSEHQNNLARITEAQDTLLTGQSSALKAFVTSTYPAVLNLLDENGALPQPVEPAAEQQLQAALDAYAALNETDRTQLSSLYDHLCALVAAVEASKPWLYDAETKTLTIQQTLHASQSWTDASVLPWVAYRLEITTVVVTDAVTALPDAALAWLPNLKTVHLGSGLVQIGGDANARLFTAASIAQTDYPHIESLTVCYADVHLSILLGGGADSVPVDTLILDNPAMVVQNAAEGNPYLQTLEVRNAQTITTGAFQGYAGLKDVTIPQGTQVGYSDALQNTPAMEAQIAALLDGQFQLNQPSPLPKPDGSQSEEQNGTQLVKSASWTDEEQTVTEVQIQFSYALDKQDFLFIMDSSEEMGQIADGSTVSKLAVMQSKLLDVIEQLTGAGSRVALVPSTEPNTPTDFLTDAQTLSGRVMDLVPTGQNDYMAALENTQKLLALQADDARQVTVIVLKGDGSDMPSDASEGLEIVEVQLTGNIQGFSQAVNEAVSSGFHPFTLTDQIGSSFTLNENTLSASVGTVSYAEDTRTLTWEITGAMPHTPCTLTFQLTRSGNSEGSLAVGQATVKDAAGHTVVAVQSPVLSGNADAPDEELPPDSGEDEDPTPEPDWPDWDWPDFWPDPTWPDWVKPEPEPEPEPEPGEEEQPPVEEPDLAGHTAYIFGYPEDYRTGQATADASLWPVKPEVNITREEVAAIFVRLFDEETLRASWSTVSRFADVSSGRWSSPSVATAANAGLVAGYTDGTFRPGANMTRAEFATILCKFGNLTYNGPNQFTDTGGHWANDYINRAAANGWIQGYADGTFRPDAYITRAEAIALINAMLGRSPDTGQMLADMRTWPDNDPDAWYYADVQEATNSHWCEQEPGKPEQWVAMM